MAEDTLSIEEILDAPDLAPHEKKGLLLKLYPRFLETGGMNEEGVKPPAEKNTVGGFFGPTMDVLGGMGGMVADAWKKTPQVPGAMLDLMKQGREPFTAMSQQLGGEIAEATALGAEEEGRTAEPFPRARGALASIPFVGKPVARALGKGASGDITGAAGEALPFLLPGAVGKLGNRVAGPGGMLARAEEAAGVATRAAQSPMGQMAKRLGLDEPGVGKNLIALNRAENVANEQLASMKAPLVSGSGNPEQVREGIARALDEARTVAQKGALQRFGDRVTPTEAGTLVAPTMKATRAEMLAKFPKGTKGYKEKFVPSFVRGAPARGLKAHRTELASRVADIPLDDAQQWKMLMDSAKGDEVAIRSHVANNLMDGAKSPAAFVEKFRTMPPDTAYAIFGPDAGPTYQILQRIAQLEEAAAGGNKTLQALDDVLKGMGGDKSTQIGLSHVLTGLNMPVGLRTAAVVSRLLGSGRPGSVLTFARAFDKFTRGGSPPAFISTVNSLSRISKDDE